MNQPSFWDVWGAILIVALVLIAAIICLGFLTGATVLSYDCYRRRKKYLRQLANGTQNGTITDWEHFKDEFQFIFRGAKFPYNKEAYFIHCIEEFRSELIGESPEKSKENVEWKNRIDSFLEEANREEPYVELSEKEQGLLQKIGKALLDDEELTKDLETLSSLMIFDKRVIDKHVKRNKWATPLAILSTIVALGFGILQVVAMFS